jgi:hypothetical protein
VNIARLPELLQQDRLKTESGGGGSFIAGVGSLARCGFDVLSLWAANTSHALAISSRSRLDSGSRKFWASCRHFSAFSRYRSARSNTRDPPLRQRRNCG